MAIRKPIVIISGIAQELPGGDVVLPSPPDSRTGMALVFDRDANYGYPTAETGSAFTITDSSAVMGVILKVRINRATEPTYFSRATCISGKFKASVNNYYYFECVYVAGSGGSSNLYEYTISQTPT